MWGFFSFDEQAEQFKSRAILRVQPNTVSPKFLHPFLLYEPKKLNIAT